MGTPILVFFKEKTMPVQKQRKPFGLWSSPISPDVLSQSLRLDDLAWDSDGQTLGWVEGRSDRNTLVVQPRG